MNSVEGNPDLRVSRLAPNLRFWTLGGVGCDASGGASDENAKTKTNTAGRPLADGRGKHGVEYAATLLGLGVG